MTKQDILNTITQQEQAAWLQLKSLLLNKNQSLYDKPLSAPVTRAKEKWSTLYCLLEKVQQ